MSKKYQIVQGSHFDMIANYCIKIVLLSFILLRLEYANGQDSMK